MKRETARSFYKIKYKLMIFRNVWSLLGVIWEGLQIPMDWLTPGALLKCLMPGHKLLGTRFGNMRTFSRFSKVGKIITATIKTHSVSSEAYI